MSRAMTGRKSTNWPCRTIGFASPGQAIDWDPVKPGLLWSIDRARNDMIGSRSDAGR